MPQVPIGSTAVFFSDLATSAGRICIPQESSSVRTWLPLSEGIPVWCAFHIVVWLWLCYIASSPEGCTRSLKWVSAGQCASLVGRPGTSVYGGSTRIGPHSLCSGSHASVRHTGCCIPGCSLNRWHSLLCSCRTLPHVRNSSNLPRKKIWDFWNILKNFGKFEKFLADFELFQKCSKKKQILLPSRNPKLKHIPDFSGKKAETFLSCSWKLSVDFLS